MVLVQRVVGAAVSDKVCASAAPHLRHAAPDAKTTSMHSTMSAPRRNSHVDCRGVLNWAAQDHQKVAAQALVLQHSAGEHS